MKKSFFILLVCLFCFVGCSAERESNSTHINYTQAKEQIINNGAVLMDVRTKEEYDEGHIDGAILLTLDDINETTVSNVIDDKEQVIIVYCRSGNRSSQALEILKDLGYNNVYDLGAMSNWQE